MIYTNYVQTFFGTGLKNRNESFLASHSCTFGTFWSNCGLLFAYCPFALLPCFLQYKSATQQAISKEISPGTKENLIIV